jgi:hypothetical protein
MQINKITRHKEFFRAGLSGIRHVIEENEIETTSTFPTQGVKYGETLKIENCLAEIPEMVSDWWRTQKDFTPDVVVAEGP